MVIFYEKYILYYYTIIVLILPYNIVCDHGMAMHFNTGVKYRGLLEGKFKD